MLSTVVFCATVAFCGAEPAEQSQPAAAVSQAVSQTQAPKPADAPNPQPPKTATAPEKKTEPQVHVAYRLPTDPPRTEPKPGQKTEPKFELLAIEQSVVDATNAERARYGRPAFSVDANLMATARQHCTWMTTNRQLVHARIGVAENIAMGQSSSQEVVRTWMNSSGHRANILNGGHRRIGVAAYQTPEGTIYWCQQFTP
ncbi:MAG: CAP domain-containing protein [Planctomycetota bacterium]